MRREIFGWWSPRLEQDMPIVQYGHWGHALLLLPTAQADFLEYERFKLIQAIEPLIEDGRVRVFSVDSINNRAWMNDDVPMGHKSWLQAMYSGYIEEEVVPHVRRVLQNPGARIGVSGASFGAFHAANAFCRRPDLFDTLIAMSGFFDLGSILEGYSDERVYFNNPGWYLPELHDHGTLELMRHSQIHIVSGQGDYERPEISRRFSDLLWSKGVPNNLDLWGYDVPHEWPTWRKMLSHYIDQRLGW